MFYLQPVFRLYNEKKIPEIIVVILRYNRTKEFNNRQASRRNRKYINLLHLPDV